MDIINKSERSKKAENYFRNGYNCAQSVVLTFADLTDLSNEKLLRIASAFGGGMGRLREVCGAVSGMFIILGLVRGYSSPTDKNGKADLYSEVQKLAEEFKEKSGSIICRDLLSNVPHTDGSVPEQRNSAYYNNRPCAKLVGLAAEILENHLKMTGSII